MPIALSPSEIFRLLDISNAKLLLGKKETDPTLWRILSDAQKGKTQTAYQKTKDKVDRLLRGNVARISGVTPTDPSLLDQIEQTPDGSEWEVCISAFEHGLTTAETKPPTFFSTEATRLDRASRPIKTLIEAGEFELALQEIKRVDMPSTPSFDNILGQIECGRGSERFIASACPIVIYTTLYLLACWEVDYTLGDEPSNAAFLPIRSDGKDIRPMTRWLGFLRTKFELTTISSLAEFLLTTIDEDSSVPELKKWYYRGVIPAWSRVPTIATSLAQKLSPDDREQIEFELICRLAVLRILNGLLDFGLEIQKHHHPAFNPMALFQDYSLMLAYAEERKKGLPTGTDR